jgi:hypothetical protein
VSILWRKRERWCSKLPLRFDHRRLIRHFSATEPCGYAICCAAALCQVPLLSIRLRQCDTRIRFEDQKLTNKWQKKHQKKVGFGHVKLF